MNYYEQIYLLKEKDKYVTAQSIKGAHEGEHAVFAEDGLFYHDGDAMFWDNVYENWKKESFDKNMVEMQGECIYIEKLSEQMRLVICGAGHISIPLTKMAKMLGFYVTVIDDRKEFVDNAIEAGADEATCGSYVDNLKKVTGDKNTFFAIITRGHRYDRTCLEAVIDKEYAYLGMIGSVSRVSKQMQEMKEAGISAELLDQVHTPIGLSIGAQTPEEIAVSIIAEMIQVKNSRAKTSGFEKKTLLAAANRNEAVNHLKKALVTIVDKKGSGPRDAGTKMLVLEDGKIIGTIGGGCLESDMQKIALECIEKKKNLLYHYEMSLKDAEEDGMACGGAVDLYVEVIS